MNKELPWWLSGKEPACQCRKCRFHPWVEKIPGEGNGNPLQYSCLRNPTDGGALVSYSLWCRKRVGHDSQLTIQQQQNEQENFCYSFRECSFPLPLSVSILEYRCLPPSLQQQDLREWWRLFWFGENYICYFYVTLFKWRKKAFN